MISVERYAISCRLYRVNTMYTLLYIVVRVYRMKWINYYTTTKSLIFEIIYFYIEEHSFLRIIVLCVSKRLIQ